VDIFREPRTVNWCEFADFETFLGATDPVYRPVLVVGPLSDCVTDRLELDFPDLFTRCQPVILEKSVSDPAFIDCKKKGSYYEYTAVAAIREICEKVI